MNQKPQTVNVDRIRLAAPWAAWWAMFAAVCIGVWHVRGAKSFMEQVVVEVRELRVEAKELRTEIRQAQEKQHQLELDIKGVKTKLGISATFSTPVVTAAK
jgi:hypothetical protein